MLGTWLVLSKHLLSALYTFYIFLYFIYFLKFKFWTCVLQKYCCQLQTTKHLSCSSPCAWFMLGLNSKQESHG